MDDAFAAMMDAKRRDGQRESAERLGEMAGGAASIGLPSRNAGSRRPIPGVSGGSPSLEKSAAAPMPPVPRAGFYRGDGGYEYIVGPRGEITIANSPNPRGIGTIVEMDSPFYDDIAVELATKRGGDAIPGPVSTRLKAAQAPKAAVTKSAPVVMKSAAAVVPALVSEPGESSTVEEEPEYGVSEDVGTPAPSSVFKAFVDELTARNPDLGTAIREFAWDKPKADILGETLLALTRSNLPKDGKYANVDLKSRMGLHYRK